MDTCAKHEHLYRSASQQQACVDHAHRPAGQPVSITGQPATPTTGHSLRHVTYTCGFNNSIDKFVVCFDPQVERAIPAFASQPQRATALWLVLIYRPAEGWRLSWPRWLGEILRCFARPKTATHPSNTSGGRELNSRPSSCHSNALTTRVPSHHYRHLYILNAVRCP